MTTKDLAQIIERIPSWPAEAQTEALAYLELIERELYGSYALTEEDKASIERGLEDARQGRFVSPERMEALFAHYRAR